MPMLPPPSRRNQKQTGKANTYRLHREADEGLAKGSVRSTSRWQKVREMYLKRHPMCENPHNAHDQEHHENAATEVHHIMRIQDRPELAFTFDNLASLCGSCHAVISRRETTEGRSCPEYFKGKRQC